MKNAITYGYGGTVRISMTDSKFPHDYWGVDEYGVATGVRPHTTDRRIL
jgi:hypothetical protein